jgi:hypothetical protein
MGWLESLTIFDPWVYTSTSTSNGSAFKGKGYKIKDMFKMDQNVPNADVDVSLERADKGVIKETLQNGEKFDWYVPREISVDDKKQIANVLENKTVGEMYTHFNTIRYKWSQPLYITQESFAKYINEKKAAEEARAAEKAKAAQTLKPLPAPGALNNTGNTGGTRRKTKNAKKGRRKSRKQRKSNKNRRTPRSRK